VNASLGVRGRRISETPFAVIDFETTGLRAGPDRVVEVTVIALAPGEEPKLILDTLINPCRPMAATEIHGITDDDVRDAPTFREVAGDLARALAGCVVASYNVYFDVPFLQYELGQAGLQARVPHACVMYLRPALDLGNRCCLSEACRQHGLQHDLAHATAADAAAAARLLQFCLTVMNARGVTTFEELAALRDYKFFRSFDDSPLSPDAANQLPPGARRKSRFQPAAITPGATSAGAMPAAANARAIYWDALRAILSDLEVTQEEIASLARTKREVNLSADEIRALHARAFSQAISQVMEDRRLDERECELLARLHCCLRTLGWAPGDPCATA
jgi:DNA polymerase-3 subunit epsilon